MTKNEQKRILAEPWPNPTQRQRVDMFLDKWATRLLIDGGDEEFIGDVFELAERCYEEGKFRGIRAGIQSEEGE